MKMVERINHVEVITLQNLDHIIALQLFTEEIQIFHCLAQPTRTDFSVTGLVGILGFNH